MVKRFNSYNKDTGFMSSGKYYCDGGDYVTHKDYAALLDVAREMAKAVEIARNNCSSSCFGCDEQKYCVYYKALAKFKEFDNE